MASTDRAALLALFRSTHGSGWKNSNNWNTTAPLSEWYGVYVDHEGRVVKLWLPDNNLQGRYAYAYLGLLCRQIDAYGVSHENFDRSSSWPLEMRKGAELTSSQQCVLVLSCLLPEG